MIPIQQILDYTATLKDVIAPINHTDFVVDEDELVSRLGTLGPQHNQMLFCVLPATQVDPGDEDRVEDTVTVDFLVLKKQPARQGTAARMDAFTDTYNTCVMVRDRIFQDARGEHDLACGGWLQRIFSGGSMSIQPIYGKSGTLGWMVNVVVPSYD